MSTGTTVAIIVVIVIVIAVAIAAFTAMAARRRQLRQRFGPEYDRTVAARHSQRKAQAELTRRERRVRKLGIRPLTPEAQAEYAAHWASIQERFVDQPTSAVTQAQELVAAVLHDRGYPTDGQGQLLADLSVDHARTLEHYRAAYSISESASVGGASTEDLRQAMIHFRAMFEELLAARTDAQPSRAQASGVDPTPSGTTAASANGECAPSGRAATADGETAPRGKGIAPANSDPTVTGDRAGETRS